MQSQLTWTRDPMSGALTSTGADDQLTAMEGQFYRTADEHAGHAVSGRAISDRPQAIDLSDRDRGHCRSERWQGPQHVPFGGEADVGHRDDLGVDPAVHLGAPGQRVLVGRLNRRVWVTDSELGVSGP